MTAGARLGAAVCSRVGRACQAQRAWERWGRVSLAAGGFPCAGALRIRACRAA